MVLEFEENKLTEIKSKSFEYLTKLKILKIGRNKIEQIDSNGIIFYGYGNFSKLF